MLSLPLPKLITVKYSQREYEHIHSLTHPLTISHWEHNNQITHTQMCGNVSHVWFELWCFFRYGFVCVCVFCVFIAFFPWPLSQPSYEITAYINPFFPFVVFKYKLFFSTLKKSGWDRIGHVFCSVVLFWARVHCKESAKKMRDSK